MKGKPRRVLGERSSRYHAEKYAGRAQRAERRGPVLVKDGPARPLSGHEALGGPVAVPAAERAFWLAVTGKRA